MGKRARKIHQREMEGENPSICSYLIFSSRLETCCTEITLFSPEVRLDMTVVSGARCTAQDPWRARSRPGEGSCQRLRGDQSPWAASSPPSSEHTQESDPSGKFIISIHQRQTFRMNRGPCVPRPTPRCRDDSKGTSEGWGSALTLVTYVLCSLIFSPRSNILFFTFFPPRILPLLPSLEYCGVFFFFFESTFLLASKNELTRLYLRGQRFLEKPFPSSPLWWRCSLASLAKGMSNMV